MKTLRPALALAVLGSSLAMCLAAQKAPSDAKPQWVLPAISAPRVQHRTFDSAAAKTKVSYFIYTPESYDTKKEQSFPVLYWLHGSGGGSAGVPELARLFRRATFHSSRRRLARAG